MFVYWSKKEKWYRDIESVSTDFCENCNSKRIHTYRLYEERRKHYSVISGPTKRSVRVICEACKGESKPEKKHEKHLIAKFTARILIAEGYELIQQQNHGKALKKFRESMKNLDSLFKGLSSFKHTDFYTRDLQFHDQLKFQCSYGLATCCIQEYLKKNNDTLWSSGKKHLDFLESILPDDEDVKKLKNLYISTHPQNEKETDEERELRLKLHAEERELQLKEDAEERELQLKEDAEKKVEDEYNAKLDRFEAETIRTLFDEGRELMNKLEKFVKSDELMRQRNYGEALKKFNECKKKLEVLIGGISEFKETGLISPEALGYWDWLRDKCLWRLEALTPQALEERELQLKLGVELTKKVQDEHNSDSHGNAGIISTKSSKDTIGDDGFYQLD